MRQFAIYMLRGMAACFMVVFLTITIFLMWQLAPSSEATYSNKKIKVTPKLSETILRPAIDVWKPEWVIPVLKCLNKSPYAVRKLLHSKQESCSPDNNFPGTTLCSYPYKDTEDDGVIFGFRHHKAIQINVILPHNQSDPDRVLEFIGLHANDLVNQSDYYSPSGSFQTRTWEGEMLGYHFLKVSVLKAGYKRFSMVALSDDPNDDP